MAGSKGSISESDVSSLLRRYTTSTILALLHEIFNAADTKLNWSALVKNTNTGITNAREYQSLWRNLAYCTRIPDNFEDDMEVLEDDSDLEFEVEPVPAISNEVANEVAACVKALESSGTSANGSSKNQEPCFIIEIPNSSSGWKVKGNGQVSNVTISGAQTSEAQPARKKRKLWTIEEDQELIAAVEKCGEGNWANMLKGVFKHERTAAQLSQRWALIRKRRDIQTGTQNQTTENQSSANTANVSGNQSQTEPNSSAAADAQKAGVPSQMPTGNGGGGNTPAPCSQEQVPCQTPSIQMTSVPQQPAKGKAATKGGKGASQQARLTSTNPTDGLSAQVVDSRQNKTIASNPVSLPVANSVPSRYNASSGSRNTPVNTMGRATTKASAGPDPMVQAAAVAAGARIAPASAAASLLKAAQSGNVVHIGPGGLPMSKSGAQNQACSNSATSNIKVGANNGSRTSGTTLVHYIRTGTRSTQGIHLPGQRTQIKGQISRANASQLMQPTVRSNPSPANLSTPQKIHPTVSNSVPMEKPKSSLSSVLSGDCQGTVSSDSNNSLSSDGVNACTNQNVQTANRVNQTLISKPETELKLEESAKHIPEIQALEGM